MSGLGSACAAGAREPAALAVLAPAGRAVHRSPRLSRPPPAGFGVDLE